MMRARALQDETGGFQAFIPLAFHPDNNQMRKLPAPSASDTLRVHAVARLMLDNIPHVKAFWIATGVEVAQIALWYGADDLDGTVQEEHIYHMAGSRTPETLTTADIRRLIRAAGREPVERDTLYNVITDRPKAAGLRLGTCEPGRKASRPTVAMQPAGRVADGPCVPSLEPVTAKLRLSQVPMPAIAGGRRRPTGFGLFHVWRLRKISQAHELRRDAMSQIQVLTDYEKTRLGERQPLPRRLSAPARRGDGRPHRRRQGGARRPPRHPRPPLPARRSHQVRRLHRRLAEARAARRRASTTPTSSSSAASTSWPRARTSSARRISRSSCPISPPAARWPTWPRSISSRSAGRSCGDLGVHERRPGHVHQLHGRHQRLLRRARRHRLHVEQRGEGDGVGVGAAARSC